MTRSLLVSLGVGLAGVGATALLGIHDPARALTAYLAAYGASVSIAVGALLLSFITYVTRATWFVVLRRPTEAIAGTLPLLVVLFVPIALGVHAIYPWAHPDPTLNGEEARQISRAAAWLTPGFFVVRGFFYLVTFAVPAALLRQASRAPRSRVNPRVVSAAGLPVVALTLTFAAFDWFMSFQPGWMSDIFGVYVFAGGFAGALAALTLCLPFVKTDADAPLAQAEAKRVPASPSHVHALGRLLLTAVIFWGYIAVCQLLLIWIADMPREIPFYGERVRGAWVIAAALVGVLHFGLPFLLLLSRPLKRAAGSLAWVGGIVLVAHAIDAVWMVVPSRYAGPLPVDLTALLGVGGLCTAFGIFRFGALPAVPLDDPKLAQSLRYESP